MKQASYTSQKGFSLIELSAILTLAAILAVGYLQWLQSSSSAQADARLITQHKIKVIERAVLNFIDTYKRLPCPMNPLLRDDGTLSSGATSMLKFGWENTTHSSSPSNKVCNNPIGSVPIHALGLDKLYMLDGWNRRFTFHVSPARCNNRAADNISCLAEDYADDTIIRDGTIFDLTIENQITAFIHPQHAMFVIVSHGPNGLGAYTDAGIILAAPNAVSQADEFANYDGHVTASSLLTHATYVIESNQTGFDDIVRYHTKKSIQTRTQNYYPITATECNANSTQIGNLTLTDITQMDTTINDYSFTGKDATATNLGGDLVFDLLWTLQTICSHSNYYGTTASASWNGVSCPGGGSFSTSCNCNNGAWNGSC